MGNTWEPSIAGEPLAVLLGDEPLGAENMHIMGMALAELHLANQLIK